VAGISASPQTGLRYFCFLVGTFSEIAVLALRNIFSIFKGGSKRLRSGYGVICRYSASRGAAPHGAPRLQRRRHISL